MPVPITGVCSWGSIMPYAVRLCATTLLDGPGAGQTVSLPGPRRLCVRLCGGLLGEFCTGVCALRGWWVVVCGKKFSLLGLFASWP